MQSQTIGSSLAETASSAEFGLRWHCSAVKCHLGLELNFIEKPILDGTLAFKGLYFVLISGFVFVSKNAFRLHIRHKSSHWETKKLFSTKQTFIPLLGLCEQTMNQLFLWSTFRRLTTNLGKYCNKKGFLSSKVSTLLERKVVAFIAIKVRPLFGSQSLDKQLMNILWKFFSNSVKDLIDRQIL